jgi:hypothetical protein
MLASPIAAIALLAHGFDPGRRRTIPTIAHDAISEKLSVIAIRTKTA